MRRNAFAEARETPERLPGWLDAQLVEAVIMEPCENASWLLKAYLAKHGGRWIRYRNPKDRQSDYTTPALYIAKFWAAEAMETAKAAAWDSKLPGDYWTRYQKLAFDITQFEDYPACHEIEGYWKMLA